MRRRVEGARRVPVGRIWNPSAVLLDFCNTQPASGDDVVMRPGIPLRAPATAGCSSPRRTTGHVARRPNLSAGAPGHLGDLAGPARCAQSVRETALTDEHHA